MSFLDSITNGFRNIKIPGLGSLNSWRTGFQIAGAVILAIFALLLLSTIIKMVKGDGPSMSGMMNVASMGVPQLRALGMASAATGLGR